VVLVNAFLGQETSQFVLVNTAIAVFVNFTEFLTQLPNFFRVLIELFDVVDVRISSHFRNNKFKL
jgi:hypothetical protein